MIESLHLRNFKCFRDQRVPLGGLTVLAGLNGAGKSTVIQAVLTLHQPWKGQQEVPDRGEARSSISDPFTMCYTRGPTTTW